ncbi:2'-5' RNA ligase family protein [Halocella sp. SP3-1]|uniref:2'-5' RNA ligase family protein n=1 Tax=Halocella sp. SP3-1 TaxID=2382161 RepID=UPI0013E04A8F|nr:2'-5' RNA ligase family protein [Halocella sp. SP3-1]
MPYVIELFFDKESEKEIRKLWTFLDEQGINVDMLNINSTPHISISAFEDVKLDLLKDKMKSFIKDLSSFNIKLENIGTFPNNNGVIFLGVVVTQKLLYIHKKIHDLINEYKNVQAPYYLPEKWIPHCTLGINLSKEKVSEGIKQLIEKYEPMTVKVKSIAIVEYFPAEIRYKFELEN